MNKTIKIIITVTLISVFFALPNKIKAAENVVTYTAGQSGTYNVSPGTTQIVVELWGGGAGGGAGPGNTNNAGGGGGGGGAYVIKTISSPGSSYSYSVGTGGGGGSIGNGGTNGGSTTFDGSTYTAGGGTGGGVGPLGSGGGGGSGSGGDTNRSGGNGATAISAQSGGGGGGAGTNNPGGNAGTPNVYTPGTGGSALGGDGGVGCNTGSNCTGGDAPTTSVYGGGGGGGMRNAAGGNGAGGYIRITETIPGTTLSGVIYQTNESSQYACSGGNLTINLRINGSGSYTDTCTTDSGTSWEITDITVSAGQTVYVYIDGGSVFGTTVLVSDATTQTNINIIQNRVTLRDDVNGSITNTEISTGDTADADDLITFPSSIYTVGAGYETHIYGGDTWAPGANSSTGLLHIDTSAIFSAGSNTLTLTGTSGTLITRVGTFTQGTGTVTVTSASGTPTLLSAATTFHVLTINSNATVINDGAAVTINNVAGAALTVTTGVLNFSTTPSGPGSGNGTLTVSSGATLCLGGTSNNTAATCDSTSATTAVTMPVFQTYSLNSSSTVRYTSDAATAISATPTYGILIFNPKLASTGRTYTFSAAATISGNFTVNPTASSSYALTVQLGGTTTVASSATTLLTGTTSGTSSLDTTGSNHSFSTGLLNIAAAGGLTANGSTISLTGTSGTLFTLIEVGDFTAGTSNVQVTSASGTLTLNSGSITFNTLTINPTNLSIATSADDMTAANLTVTDVGDTLSLASGQDFTLTTSLSLTGTVSGSGTLIYQSSTAFPTGGTLSAPLRMDATNNDQAIAGTGGGRTIGGNVEIYNGSAVSQRTVNLGSASSQIINFSGNVTINSANSQRVSLDGNTNNPDINITGNLSTTSGGTEEGLGTGTGVWTVSGDVDLTGSISSFINNTFRMNGSSKTLTSNGTEFNNFAVTGGSVSSLDAMVVNGTFSISGSGQFTHTVGNMTVSGTFTVTSGGFVHGAGANIDILVAGNFAIANGATWTENVTDTSQLIFNAPVSNTYTDSNPTPQSVGNVQIGNSPGTTYLSSDFSSNSLSVTSSDFFYTCGWEVDIGNGGITIDGTFDATRTAGGCSSDTDQSTINDANLFNLSGTGTFTPDQSTIIFDDNSGTNNLTTAGAGSFYNMEVNGASNTMLLKDALDVNGYLKITAGTLDAETGNGWQINVGGDWDNDATFEARGNLVVFDADSGTISIDADGTGTDVFYDIEFNQGTSATWQLTTALDADHNFTITDGTVDVNGSNQINVGNNWNNAGGTFTASSGKVLMDAQDAGNTLSGTMTGTSSFYDLEFNDSVSSGAWSFGTDSATITRDFIITGGSVTAPSTTLTIGRNFTNSDSFSHNSGTIIFNTASASTLEYATTTTFNNFTVSTGGKQMNFDDTDGVVTDIDGTLTIQGTNCTTGRIFLDPTTAFQNWDIAASGSTDIDYIDVEYSTASPALTAQNSTEDNANNSGWTINAGACGTSEVNIRGNTNIRGGVKIK